MDKRSGRRAELRAKRVALAVAAAFLPWGEGHALPTGEEIVTPGVSVTRPTTQSMQIHQGTLQKGIVNWQGFSIGATELVNVVQPNASAALLNRVVGNSPSEIFGRLTANGQVFLVNNAGVLFAPGASVSAGALVASTLSITDQNFLNGVYQFYNPCDGSNPCNTGSVVNQAGMNGVPGSIVTAGGFTALIGPQVRNDGIIIANSGKVALGAGDRVSLTMFNDGLVSINVDEAAYNASVINTGTIQADGGTVMLKASRMNALLDTVINTSGVIRASSLVERNGEIILDGGAADTVQVSGLVQAEAGRIDISAGGALNVGSTVCCFPTTIIAATQDISAGSITVGGGSQIIGNSGTGTQTITTPGTLLVRGGIQSGTVGIFHNGSGEQRISAGNVIVRGGSGNGTSALIASQGSGEQVIETSRIEITGGSFGSNNLAMIRADVGDQSVAVDGDIVVAAGVAGDALLQGSANGLQTIHVDNISIANGLGGTNSFGSIRAGHQEIHAGGNVVLTGGATTGASGGVRIGGLSGAPTDVRLFVDGDLLLTGGSTPDNGAVVGSTGAAAVTNNIFIDAGGRVVLDQGQGPGPVAGARIGNGAGLAGGNIEIHADGSIELKGVTSSTSIRTLGNVMLEAALISEASGSFIRAGTLAVKSTGNVTLAGPNQVGTLNAPSVPGVPPIPGVGGNLTFNNSTALNVGNVSSGGTMNLTVGGALTLDASTQDAVVSSVGGQTITAHSLSLTAQNGRRANIENVNGNQSVSATAGGMSLQVPTGSGVAQIVNTAAGGNQTIAVNGQLNVLGGVISPTGSRNSGIFKNGPGGLQSVSASGITLQGASNGASAGALISSQADQFVNVAGGNINLIGGDGGNTNNAVIAASPLGQQTILAHDINLSNGSDGAGTVGTDTLAGIFGGHQLIDVTGNVTLTSRGALLGTAPGGPGVRIGAPGASTTGTDLTLLVDGNLTVNGGTAAENGAAIGSSGVVIPPASPLPNAIHIEAGGSVILNAGNPSNTGVRIGSGSSGTAGGNITIEASGSIQLNGTQRSAAIRTLGNVSLEAASISQGTNGFILADTLTTTATSGATNLIGPNQINRFNGTSGGALTLVDAGTLQVTGIATTNDAITLTTGSLTNSGTITNGGPASNANMIFNADAFNLAGGDIHANAAAVILRPRTGTNSFGIESAGQTTLTNVDIESIDTSNFVVFGSGMGTTFTGNMTIGQNAQVNGGGKHLAFFRSMNPGGTTTIGSRGVTTVVDAVTAGDVIVSAGGGAIVSIGGTVAGDEVQLRASQGIGAPAARVQTAANALAINNTGTGGAFIAEAGDVTLRDVNLTVGGIANNFGNFVGAGGAYEVAAGGSISLSGVVQAGDVRLSTNTGSITEAGAGTIVANTLTINSALSTTLNGPNQVSIFNASSATGDVSFANIGDLTFAGSALMGDLNVVNTGLLTFSGFAMAGDINITNTGTLNVTSLLGTNATVANHGPMTVSGFWNSTAATSITTTGAGSNLTVGNSVNSTGLMNVVVDGMLTVAASGLQVPPPPPPGLPPVLPVPPAPQVASLTSFAGQYIVAKSVHVSAQDGALALINNQGTGNQTVTVTGGGLAIGSSGALPPGPGGSAAQIANFTTGNQTIAVSGGGGVKVLSAGGSASIGNGMCDMTGCRPGGSQTITVSGGTGLDVQSTAAGSFASINQNAAGAAQTVSTTGSGSNAITLGSAGALGFSQISGGSIQNVTAGLADEQGSITIVGPASIVSRPGPGGMQIIATNGLLNVEGGTAQNSGAGIFNLGGGAQAVNAAAVHLRGGASGSGSGAFINSGYTSGSAQQFAVSGAITVEGGTGSSNSAGIHQVGSGSQTIEAAAVHLRGGSSGQNNGAFINSTASGNQTFTVTGEIRLEGGAGGTANRAGMVTSGSQTLNGNPDLILVGGGGGADGLGNNVFINATGGDAKPQIINARNVLLAAGLGVDASATMGASRQIITASGDVSVLGSDGLGSLQGARIGGLFGPTPTPTNLTLTVGGDLLLRGGGGPSNGVALGSAATSTQSNAITITTLSGDVILESGAGPGARIGSSSLAPSVAPGDINITTGGDIHLNGAAQPTAIRTLGTVTLNAANISEASSGLIVAGALNTTTSGSTSLVGPNQVAMFNASSTGGDVSLNNTGALDVTGMNVFGDATIANIGDVTVSGPWTAGGTSTITVGSDILLQSTMQSHDVVLVATSGAIIQERPNASIAAESLTTSSVGDTVLEGDNAVKKISASSTEGDISVKTISPVLTLSAIELAGALLVKHTGAVAISGEVSALSHDIAATGDVTVGGADARDATLLYAPGFITIATPGSIIVRGSDTRAGAGSAVIAGGALNFNAENVTLLGGSALATPAIVRGSTVDMSVERLGVTGGSGHLSPAWLLSGSNINLTVGDAVSLQTGSGLHSWAKVQTETRDATISITFRDGSGAYFVDGIEGDVKHGQTGFYTLLKPVKVGDTLILEYDAP